MTEKEKIAVTDRNLSRFLGKEKYTYQMANAAPEVGIVRGLAWTSVGGDTLQIEVNVMPGKGEIMLTGKLGDVMKESARTGISYIRSVSKKYAIQEDFFEKHDIMCIFLKERYRKTDRQQELQWQQPSSPQ